MSSPGQRFRSRAQGRAAFPQGVAAGGAPFSSFMARHEERERRSRGKRRMLAASVAVHVVVFGVVWALSVWKVDELFGRQVEVSVKAPEPEVGADGKPKHRFPTNIGRALGFHLVVTPAGATAEPRADGVAASAELVKQLRPLVVNTLLPSLVYPNDAASLRLRGAVSVLVDVDSQGAVTALDVKLPCSNQLLCKVAKDAVAQIAVWPKSKTADERSFLVPIEYRPD